MAVTADWQCDFGGLTIGDGTSYELTAVSGLLDLADLRSSDRTRLLRDGLLPGVDLLGGRTFEVDVCVWPDPPGDLGSLLSALTGAFSSGPEQPFTFRLPPVAGGGLRQLNARVRRRKAPIDPTAIWGQQNVDIELFATDPRMYDAVTQTASTTLPTDPGGLKFDAVSPLTFGAMPSGGTLTLVNAGNTPTAPVFVGVGPLPAVWLTNTTTGRAFYLDAAVPAGATVTIDFSAKTVMLNGTASRYSSVRAGSDFWALAPGANSVSFFAPAFASGSVVASWRSAWL